MQLEAKIEEKKYMLQTISWNIYLSLESSGRMMSDWRRGRRNPDFCFLASLIIDFLWSSVCRCSPSTDAEAGAQFFGSWLLPVRAQGHLPLPGASVPLPWKWEVWSCTNRSCLSASSEGWLFPVASDVAEVVLELNPLHWSRDWIMAAISVLPLRLWFCP